MKISSVNDWDLGDKGITRTGEIVTVKDIIADRYILIEEKHIEQQVYIPSHGELAKYLHGESL